MQPTLKLLEASATPEEWKEIIKSSVDAFKAMFSDDLVLHVTNKAKLYAVQHGKDNLNILEDEIRTFIVFLLLLGYCKVPCHIKIFIGQMHLTHTMKQSHMQ